MNLRYSADLIGHSFPQEDFAGLQGPMIAALYRVLRPQAMP
jgi:hypothetical protein